MSETPNPTPTPPPPAAAPAPAPAAAPPAPAPFGKFEPIACAHVCSLCGKQMRKNNHEYHGPVSQDMLLAIRKEHPKFHIKQAFCKECGEAWLTKGGTKRNPAWMGRRLG